MNLNEFKLEKEDGENYHISHPNGRKLVIHKKSLSDHAQKAIKKMASGGEVHGQGHALKQGTAKFNKSKMFEPQTKPIQHFDDGGTAQPNVSDQPPMMLQQNAPEASATEVNPQQPLVGAPPFDTQGTYEKLYAQQRAGNPGEPEAMSREAAMTATEQAKKAAEGSDVASKFVTGLNSAAQSYTEKNNYQSAVDENNRRLALGLAPLPLPPKPVEQSPMTANQVPEQSIAPQQPVGQGPQQANPFAESSAANEALLNKRIGEGNEYLSAISSASKNANAAYNQNVEDLKNLKSPQEIYDKFALQDHQLMDAYLKKTVDPKRFQHNMGTTSRVLSGIAMIFGGLGQGLGQRTNPGVEWLNKAIDNDIESQKNEQGKAMTLWRMNREAYGNEAQANLQTRNQLITGVQAQIAHAAANANSAQIKFNAQQVINNFEQQKIQGRQRMTMLTQGLGQSGAGTSIDPALFANDPTIVPPEHQKAYIAEVGKAKYLASNEQRMMDAYEKMEQEKKLGPSALRGFGEAPSEANLTNMALPLIKDEAGRPDEFKLNEFKKLLPGTFEYKSTGETHKEGFRNFVRGLASTPTADALNIHLDNFPQTTMDPAKRLSPQMRQYHDFAKANPNHPASQAFFDKNPGLR